MFKGHVCCTETVNSLQFPVNVRKSHSQHQCTLHLACGDYMLFVWV